MNVQIHQIVVNTIRLVHVVNPVAYVLKDQQDLKDQLDLQDLKVSKDFKEFKDLLVILV